MSETVRSFEIVLDNIDKMETDGTNDVYGVGNILRYIASLIEKGESHFNICDNTGKKFGYAKIYYREK